MNLTKGTLQLTILLGVVILILVGIGGYLVWQVQKQPTPILPTPSASSTQPLPQTTSQPATPSATTINWKTYRNEKYGFEFRYPEDYEIDEREGRIFSPEDTFWTIYITPIPNTAHSVQTFYFTGALNAIIIENQKVADTIKGDKIYYAFPSDDSWQGVYRATIELPNELKEKPFWKEIAFIGASLTINYSKDDFGDLNKTDIRQIIIQRLINKEDPISKVFDQILSTFKFINTKDTTNWKTYRNEKYGFEFEYPPYFNLFEGEKAKYPPGALYPPEGFVTGEPKVRISMSEEKYQNTNLTDVSLSIHISKDPEVLSRCLKSYYSEKPLSLTKEINGHLFYKDFVREGGGGHRYDIISYRTIFHESCYEISFVLYWTNLYKELNLEKFDREQVLEELNQILSTFKFINTKDTTNWKTYRNEKYGFEFKYPDDWTIEETSMGVLFLSSQDRKNRQIEDPHFHTFSMFVTVSKETTPQEELKKRFGLTEIKEFKISPEESNWSVDEVKKITIGESFQGYYIHHWIQSFPECYYIFEADNRVFQIQRDGRYECLDDETFNLVLSTFKPIGSSSL